MITSIENNQVKQLVQLNKKSKVRKEQNRFIVEGLKMFLEAPADRIEAIYVSEHFYTQKTNMKYLPQGSYEVLSDKVFSHVSDTQTPQGILCVVKQPVYTLEDLLGKERATSLLVIEGVQDPGNLGTMFRAGEGAGMTGVIMNQTTVDLYNPKTIRSTMGSIYRIPYLCVDNLSEIISQLKEKQISVCAAHLKGTCDYDEADYSRGCAFLIGNEGNGLSDEISSQADCLVRIPMEGKVESLNAAIAASLLLYEAKRQRKNNKAGK